MSQFGDSESEESTKWVLFSRSTLCLLLIDNPMSMNESQSDDENSMLESFFLIVAW